MIRHSRNDAGRKKQPTFSPISSFQRNTKPKLNIAVNKKRTFDIPSSSLNERSYHRRIDAIRDFVAHIVREHVVVLGEYFDGGEVEVEQVRRPGGGGAVD